MKSLTLILKWKFARIKSKYDSKFIYLFCQTRNLKQVNDQLGPPVFKRMNDICIDNFVNSYGFTAEF